MFLSSLCSICISPPPANSSLITSFPSPSVCVHMRCIPLWRVSLQFTEVSHLRQTFFRVLPEFFYVCVIKAPPLFSRSSSSPPLAVFFAVLIPPIFTLPPHTWRLLVLFFSSPTCSVLSSFLFHTPLFFFFSHVWNSERILELRHKIA